MESDSELSILKALEAERKKNQDLQERIRLTEEETKKFVRPIQKSELLTDFSGMSKELSKKLNSLQKVGFTQKESFLNSIETCDNKFKTILQDSIEKLFEEKLILESTLEQEREVIIQTMSKKIAQAYTDQIEASTRSRSVSDLESGKESEEVVNSSFGSDSENSRGELNTDDKRRIKMLEIELECVKQQMKMTKREAKKRKC